MKHTRTVEHVCSIVRFASDETQGEWNTWGVKLTHPQEMKRFKIGSEIVKAKIIDISVNGDLVLNINNKQNNSYQSAKSMKTFF